MNETTNTVTIQFGPGNCIRKSITNTNQIQSSWIEALGADPDRVEFFVNGQPHSGVLENGTTVELKTKANEKGC